MSGPLKRFDPTGLDAYKPAEVAQRIEDAGVHKAGLPALQLATLSVLAGVFIALGAAAVTAAMVGTDLSFGPSRRAGRPVRRSIWADSCTT